MRCIKTGMNALIQGSFHIGDLYINGNGLVMRANQLTMTEPCHPCRLSAPVDYDSVYQDDGINVFTFQVKDVEINQAMMDHLAKWEPNLCMDHSFNVVDEVNYGS